MGLKNIKLSLFDKVRVEHIQVNQSVYIVVPHICPATVPSTTPSPNSWLVPIPTKEGGVLWFWAKL